MLLVVTIISLVGSKAFSRASGVLFIVLIVSSFSIPLSSFLVRRFSNSNRSGGNIEYTGISLKSLKDNLWPRFTSGAAGSSNPLRKRVDCKCVWSFLSCYCWSVCGGKYVWRLEESKCFDSERNISWDGSYVFHLCCCDILDGCNCDKEYPVYRYKCHARCSTFEIVSYSRSICRHTSS